MFHDLPDWFIVVIYLLNILVNVICIALGLFIFYHFWVLPSL